MKWNWKRFWKIIGRNALFLSILVVVYLIFFRFTGEGCPIFWLTGVECPMCGMTRAHLAALRLDFAAAFSFHPLFPVGVPFILLLMNDDLFPGKWKRVYYIIVGSMGAALILRYIISLFCL